MFRFVPRFAAVLLLVVAGALAPAAAKERPFKASGEGDVAGDLYGGGKATHLGRSSLYVGLHVDPESYFYFVPYGAYLTSASGDRLYFDFDADYYVFVGTTGIISATVTFTGGTGRFQDATGSADVVFDLYQYLFNGGFSFTFLIDGSIDY
jgi:hypothetical protein